MYANVNTHDAYACNAHCCKKNKEKKRAKNKPLVLQKDMSNQTFDISWNYEQLSNEHWNELSNCYIAIDNEITSTLHIPEIYSNQTNDNWLVKQTKDMHNSIGDCFNILSISKFQPLAWTQVLHFRSRNFYDKVDSRRVTAMSSWNRFDSFGEIIVYLAAIEVFSGLLLKYLKICWLTTNYSELVGFDSCSSFVTVFFYFGNFDATVNFQN